MKAKNKEAVHRRQSEPLSATNNIHRQIRTEDMESFRKMKAGGKENCERSHHNEKSKDHHPCQQTRPAEAKPSALINRAGSDSDEQARG